MGAMILCRLRTHENMDMDMDMDMECCLTTGTLAARGSPRLSVQWSVRERVEGRSA